jgi:hypothetical protein
MGEARREPASSCLSGALNTQATYHNLTLLLNRILSNDRRTVVVVTPYHTLPVDPEGLVNVLNGTVAAAVNQEAMTYGSRVRLAFLPSVHGHGCGEPQSWMLGFRDTCLHPNHAGIREYAKAVLATWTSTPRSTPSQGKVLGFVGSYADSLLAKTVGLATLELDAYSYVGERVTDAVVHFFVPTAPASARAASISGQRTREITVRAKLRFRHGRAPVRVRIPPAARHRARVTVQILRRPATCPRSGPCTPRAGRSLNLGFVPVPSETTAK